MGGAGSSASGIGVSNRDTQAALAYYAATKHAPGVGSPPYDYRANPRDRPLPYKIYSQLEPLPLPRDFAPTIGSALDAIRGTASPVESTTSGHIDLTTLGRLCLYSNGITRWLRRMSGPRAFRAAGTTGALYHVELYLVCGDLPDLAAGIYHYGAHDHALRKLCDGDLRGVLVEATAHEEAISQAQLIVVCTSTFWRNAWRYRARAYRHSFWDGGTVLANLLALAAGAGIGARVVVGFQDPVVNALIDVDPDHEAAIALVALGVTDRTPTPTHQPTAATHHATEPLSRREVHFPTISTIQAASSLFTLDEVSDWRQTQAAAMPRLLSNPLSAQDPPIQAIESVIRRRGSTRRFGNVPIGSAQLSSLLETGVLPIPLDVGDAIPLEQYLIVQAVDGLDSGAYIFNATDRSLNLLRPGSFRTRARYLSLSTRSRSAQRSFVVRLSLTPSQPLWLRPPRAPVPSVSPGLPPGRRGRPPHQTLDAQGRMPLPWRVCSGPGTSPMYSAAHQYPDRALSIGVSYDSKPRSH